MKPQELFDALGRGERIEESLGKGIWKPWDGTVRFHLYEYRIVPKEAPTTEKQPTPEELFAAFRNGDSVECWNGEAWDVWSGEWWDKDTKFRITEKYVAPTRDHKVPHWPAVVRLKDGTTLSDCLFASEDDAREMCGEGVVRLATEYPPIMLRW